MLNTIIEKPEKLQNNKINKVVFPNTNSVDFGSVNDFKYNYATSEIRIEDVEINFKEYNKYKARKSRISEVISTPRYMSDGKMSLLDKDQLKSWIELTKQRRQSMFVSYLYLLLFI